MERRELPDGSLVLLMGMQAALFVLIGLIVWASTGRAVWRFAMVTPEAVLSGIALGSALVIVGMAIERAFPRLYEETARLQQTSAKLLGSKHNWAMFVWISACAGVGEEALFRGGIQTFLADHVGDPAAVLVGAIAFALVHMAKPPIAIVIFVLGALFGTIYAVTGSLATVMVGHAIYDIWATRTLYRTLERLDLLPQSND